MGANHRRYLTLVEWHGRTSPSQDQWSRPIGPQLGLTEHL